MNFKLTLQYDGTEFHGWQIQGQERTVQGELTRVLEIIDGRPVTIHGSGRTDAGVHAEGQVANVHLTRTITGRKLRAAINGNLPRDLRVVEADQVNADFHARFSARGKEYMYRIVRGDVMSPFWRRYALAEARPLDLDLMRGSAGLFLGQHDWTAFSSASSDTTSRIRTIARLNIDERWDERARANLMEIRIGADGFLRYMARSITGTLLAVGRKEMAPEVVARAIEGGDRSLAAATAPACGLSLVRVDY